MINSRFTVGYCAVLYRVASYLMQICRLNHLNPSDMQASGRPDVKLQGEMRFFVYLVGHFWGIKSCEAMFTGLQWCSTKHDS